MGPAERKLVSGLIGNYFKEAKNSNLKRKGESGREMLGDSTASTRQRGPFLA